MTIQQYFKVQRSLGFEKNPVRYRRLLSICERYNKNLEKSYPELFPDYLKRICEYEINLLDTFPHEVQDAFTDENFDERLEILSHSREMEWN